MSSDSVREARVLIIGEVLWDLFPASERLGGAPLNFAAHLRRLGHAPRLISGVGTDARGGAASKAIGALDLDASLVQSTARFATGTARVRIGPSDQASFTIQRPAAYDAIELSATIVGAIVEWNPDWLYYGTLFPSHPHSRDVLFTLLNALPTAARFYDLNLRPDFDDADLVADLLRSADVVKLNEAELQFVHDRIGLPAEPERFCRAGSSQFGWRAACVTLGTCGCALLVGDEYVRADGLHVTVVDTVGAGDAFAAGFLHGVLSQWPVAEIAACANCLGALVARIHGAIPDRAPDPLPSAN